MIKYSRFCNSPKWDDNDSSLSITFFVTCAVAFFVSLVGVIALLSHGNIVGTVAVVAAFASYAYLFMRTVCAPFDSWDEQNKRLWRRYVSLSDVERAEFAKLTPREVDSMSPQAAAATLNAMNDTLTLFRSTNASKITMNEKAKEFADSIQSRKDYYNTLEGKSLD